MNMQRRFGDLEMKLVGTRGPDGLLVVLAHGYGAPGTDLVELGRALAVPPGTQFAFPSAPLRLPGLGPDARAWWPVDIARLQNEYLAGRGRVLGDEDPPGLTEAREQLGEAIQDLIRTAEAKPERLIVGGFSQGAILACDLAFRAALPLGGLVVLSGMPMAEAEWVEGMPRRAGLRVYQSHGSFDPILPFPAAKRLEALMLAGGLDVRFAAFPGGHGIPSPVLTELGSFLTELSQ